MKAEKYGMPASEAHHIIDRHFAVTQAQKRFDELYFAAALRAGPALRSKLDAVVTR